MASDGSIRFVIDTNVLFEGLTTQGSASGLLIDAWVAGMFDACATDALAYEYADVLSRKLTSARWHRLQPVLGYLLSVTHFVVVHYRWRPISPDAGDDHIVDCAMNSGAAIITWNTKDFRRAEDSLGLTVLTPSEAVRFLAAD